MDVAAVVLTLDMNDKPEAELVEACRRKEVAAFETLYKRYGKRMKSVAYHVLGNRADAEDAVHEAFVNAYRGIGQFRGDSSIVTWLCHIAVNVCYNQARRKQREVQLVMEPERAAPGPGMRVALESALKLIHPKRRMVFLLYESEGFTHAEIAAVLDIREGTSKAWLSEAKQELRKILGGSK
jgi:RNA polymerase sigma-70 factor (ECF subfamily)